MGIAPPPLLEKMQMAPPLSLRRWGCHLHSHKEGEKSIKVGPNLFGVFKKESGLHSVFDGLEKKVTQLKADEEFLRVAVRDPKAHIAVMKNGQPYPSAMQAYTAERLTDNEIRGLYHYLKTLNKPSEAGPEPASIATSRESSPVNDVERSI